MQIPQVNRSALEPVEDETKCFPTEQNQASTCTAKLPPSLPSSMNYIRLVPVPRAKLGQGKLSISHGPDSQLGMTVVHWRDIVAITLHLAGQRGHQAKPPVTPCDSAHEVSVQTPSPCRTSSAHWERPGWVVVLYKGPNKPHCCHHGHTAQGCEVPASWSLPIHLLLLISMLPAVRLLREP